MSWLSTLISSPKTTTQQNTIPQWLTDASKSNIDAANNMPTYSAYTGEGVAGLSPAQLQALGLTMGNAGMYNSAIDAAAGGATNAMNFQAPQLTAEGVGNDVQGLLNPYQHDVIDANNTELDRQRQLQRLQDDATAQRFKAFGTDNHAVLDAESSGNFNRTKALTTANLLSSGYSDALAKALQMGQGNQSAALQGAGINLQGAGALANTAIAGTNINTADVNGLLTAGGVEQGNRQAHDTFNYGENMNTYNSLWQKLQARLQATSSAPHDTTQTNTSYSSPLGQIAGLGLGAAALGFSPAGIATGLGGMAGSALGGLGLISPIPSFAPR